MEQFEWFGTWDQCGELTKFTGKLGGVSGRTICTITMLDGRPFLEFDGGRAILEGNELNKHVTHSAEIRLVELGIIDRKQKTPTVPYVAMSHCRCAPSPRQETKPIELAIERELRLLVEQSRREWEEKEKTMSEEERKERYDRSW